MSLQTEIQSTEYTEAGLSPIPQTFEDATTPFYAPATLLASSSPVGLVAMFTTNNIPAKWSLANGQALSRTAYPDLFALIGTTFGAGDGATTFNIPNLSNNMVRGRGVAPYDVLGATGGADTIALNANNLPVHTHAINDPGHNHGVTDPGHFHTVFGGQQASQIFAGGGDASCSNLNINSNTVTTGITVNNVATGVTVGNNTTTNTAVTVTNPYLVLNYIIRTLP